MLAHEAIINTTFAGEDTDPHALSWRRHTFPLLDVLIGNAHPARYVGDPGVQVGRHDVGDVWARPKKRAWIKAEPWTPRDPMTSLGRVLRHAEVLYGVVDEKERCVTLANLHLSDVDDFFDPVFGSTWGLELKAPLGWLGWARRADANDRVRVPLELASGILERMRRFLAAEARDEGTT